MRKVFSISPFYKRILALSMAFSLLFSGMGFSFSAHYCGEELRSWAVFGDSEACEMPAVKTVKCPSHEGMIIRVPNNCCEDHDITVERQSHEASLISGDVLPEVFSTVIPVLPSFRYTAEVKQKVFVSTFQRPPPIDEDIYILVQSFLL